MFGLFGDPFFSYGYRPIAPIYSGISLIPKYLDVMDDFFNRELYAEEDEDNSENTNEKKERKEKTEKKEKKSAPSNEESRVWMKTFSAHSRGGIEEVREITKDSATGMTNESRTQRIGDRWYRVDTETDKEGKTKSKEIWHNVGEEEIESFKSDWEKRTKALGISGKSESPKSIEHQK